MLKKISNALLLTAAITSLTAASVFAGGGPVAEFQADEGQTGENAPYKIVRLEENPVLSQDGSITLTEAAESGFQILKLLFPADGAVKVFRLTGIERVGGEEVIFTSAE